MRRISNGESSNKTLFVIAGQSQVTAENSTSTSQQSARSLQWSEITLDASPALVAVCDSSQGGDVWSILFREPNLLGLSDSFRPILLSASKLSGLFSKPHSIRKMWGSQNFSAKVSADWCSFYRSFIRFFFCLFMSQRRPQTWALQVSRWFLRHNYSLWLKDFERLPLEA